MWFLFWTTFSSLVFVSAVFAGIMVFKKTTEEMYGDA